MRTLLFISVFITCLFVGYQTGIWLGETYRFETIPQTPATPVAWANPATTLTTLPNGQQGLLWIGVDQLPSTSPRLESVWILSYVANNTHLTFLPLYPSLSDTDAEASLQELFHLARCGAQTCLSTDFLTTLREQVPVWSNYLILDRKALAEIASSMAPENAATPSTELYAVQDIPHAWEDPRAALLGQADLFQEICWNAVHSEAKLDFSGAILRLPDHFMSNLTPEMLAKELDQLSTQMNRLACEFPTLAMSGVGRGD